MRIVEPFSAHSTMKRYILFFAFCFLFVTCTQNTIPDLPPEEPEEPEEPDEPWFAKYQIPEDILYSISTEELAEICIHFPLYGDCMMQPHFIHCNECIDMYIRKSNALSELFKREDCLDELLKRYDEFVSNIEVNYSELGGQDLYSHQDFEILIGRYKTSDENAVEIYREILRHLVDGFETKRKFPEVFTHMYIPSSYVARMNMIENISPGTLLSKLTPSWILDYYKFVPCYISWNYGLEEAVIIDELSYELIK